MNEITVPIYLITGFLESGKTSFLNFTLQQDYFYTEGTTLLILCEEGEVEYDKAVLEMSNTVVEIIEKEEDLTTDRLAAMNILYQPERVIIEYNGMWLVSNFEKMQKPEGWVVEQQITCVDASTFQMYMANMKSIFMDMVRNSDMVVFNRCKKEDPLPTYRRGIKVANQRAEIIFEDEEGELDDVASAEEYAADLMLREFPDIAVGIVHGQMKSDEKDEVMRKFVENEYSVLVATTVIEVGVDVPNATVIVIENAERFGLSQLHQLRGRVGRGSSQSYCILISDKGSKTTRERLEVMCSTNNGFVIADEDLKMRGPGDFFGHRQHGLPQMSIADFADTKSLELSQKIADCIMDRYGDIRNDEIRLLKAEVDRLFERGGQNALN